MEYTIFLIPILILFVGAMMFKHPPKKINLIIGFRTKESMKDEKAWIFANQYCGKLWIKIGIIMLLISICIYGLIHFKLLILTEIFATIFILLQVAVIVIATFIVENKLKNEKDK